MTSDRRLPFDDEPGNPLGGPALPDPAARDAPLPDEHARRNAVDPTRNVVLEASAGTGKTRVLVERYVNLLRAGVEPDNILAITFTRKAAAEMRQRIVDRLKEAGRAVAGGRGAVARAARPPGRHRHLDDRRVLSVAAPRVPARGRHRSRLRHRRRHRGAAAGRRVAGPGAPDLPRRRAPRTTTWRWCSRSWASGGCGPGSPALLDRRLVAPQALRRYSRAGRATSTAAVACRSRGERLRACLDGVPGGLDAFLDDGPARPAAVRDARRRPARLVRRDRRCRARHAARPGGVPRCSSIGSAPIS